jgi:peptidoglycan hydrolase-like protein with peptidoglycan-binding domain
MAFGHGAGVSSTAAFATGNCAAVLCLQRAVGNRAVVRMLKQGTGGVTAAPSHLTSPRFQGEPLLEACFEDRARMTVGDRDTDTNQPVSKVQRALADLGFDLGPSGLNRDGVDGVYGPKTAAAVRAFKQREELGFEQFGDVGPGTMRRLDQLFPPQPTPDPTCADGPVSTDQDPLPDVPPFTFRLLPQAELVAEVSKQQKPPKNPLAASQPSFEPAPFQGLPNQSIPVSVTAIPTDDPDCFKCAADWTLPVAWRTLIATGPVVLNEPKRLFVSRADDMSGCPPRAFPRLLDVRELLTPDVIDLIKLGEFEHYQDFVRAFRIVGGRYLANVRRLTPARTHLRVRDPTQCETKVQSFLVRAHGRFAAPQDAQEAELPVHLQNLLVGSGDGSEQVDTATTGGQPGADFELNFLKQYTDAFIDDFLALYLAPDRDHVPDGPHIVEPEPPRDRPPILPNIDLAINPFGCDAYCRKLTARSFKGKIPGQSSDVLVKDRNIPTRQAWHAL